MRAVGKDLKACHVAEGADSFSADPEGKHRTMRASSRGTDSAQCKAQQPSLTMPIHGGLSSCRSSFLSPMRLSRGFVD